jgi:hypothetical protein
MIKVAYGIKDDSDGVGAQSAVGRRPAQGYRSDGYRTMGSTSGARAVVGCFKTRLVSQAKAVVRAVVVARVFCQVCVQLTSSEFLLLLSRLQNLERAEQALVHAHHGTSIVKFTTVVGCAEQSDELALGEELVAIFHDLVRTADEVHVVLLEESGDDIGAKSERNTTVVLAPASNVLVRIGPKEITQETAVGDISRPHDATNLLHGIQVRAQTTVHGEDLLVDDSGDGKAVEAVGESLPELDVVTTLALIVEAVNTVDRSALVVATEDEEVLRVLDLVSQQEADGLERLLATVDVVTKEEVVGLWWEATVLKEAQQIVVLSVDITTNLDGSLELEQNGLGNEDLASLRAEKTNFRFQELDLLARAAAADLEQAIDYRVEIDLMLIGHFSTEALAREDGPLKRGETRDRERWLRELSWCAGLGSCRIMWRSHYRVKEAPI